MEQKTATELCAELKVDPSFVEATIGLDTGRLLKSATHVYFIASRMGGWEVVEQCLLSGVSRVEKKTNFMGNTFVMHTKSGRWMCKDVNENIDLRTWILQKAKNIGSTSPKRSHSGGDSLNHGSVEKESSMQSEWASTTVSRPETDSIDVVSSRKGLLDESLDGFGYSDVLNADREKESASTFNQMTETPIESAPPLVSRNQDVDALLEKMSSTEESASGGGSTVVKFVIFIWICSSFLDVCN